MWFIFVILGLMLALDLAWWWYADRLLRPLRRARLWRGLLAAFAAGEVLLLVLWVADVMITGPQFDNVLARPLVPATYLWHLIALPALAALWVAPGALPLPRRSARWLRRERGEHPEHHITPAETAAAAADLALDPQTCVAPSRRQFLGAAVAPAPPVLTVGTVAWSARS